MQLHCSSYCLTLTIFTFLFNLDLGTCACDDTFHVNATTSRDLQQHFKTPTGPFSTEARAYTGTWTLDTVTSPGALPNNFSVHQALYLRLNHPVDLSSEDLGYIGLGLVVHGVKNKVLQRKPNGNGTCDNVLSDECITELVNSTRRYGANLSTLDDAGIDDLTARFRTLGGDWKALGITSKCADDFLPEAWIQAFPFATPQIAAKENTGVACASGNVTANNIPERPMFEWGSAQYNSNDFAAYDNTTQSITPLITVLFQNHTRDGNDTEGYSQAEIQCLKPQVDSASRQPPPVGNSGFRKHIEPTIGLLLMAALIFLNV